MAFPSESRLQRIRVPAGGRLLAVGDSHGNKRQVDTLLSTAGFDPRRDVMALAGDFIDRGADSPGMVQMLGFEWAYSVLGNHEYVAALSLMGDLDASVTWSLSGGAWADLLSGRDRDLLLDRLQGLPDGLLIEYEGLRIGVVHAGFPDGLSFEKGFAHVDRETLLYGNPPAVCPEDLDLLLVGHRASTPKDPAIVSLDAGAWGVLLGLEVGLAKTWRVSAEVVEAKVDTSIRECLTMRSFQHP